ncbi:Do family serine endopeptidase [Sphingomonas desiccabilis]|uniref:Probable periplasmic serine endoprotease DegP-like n=1 Tax=Sphingomonas desiccabilis TaxID=429134 RepID=A0A4Q2IS69_9SPHN|nr:Do family serine endopeptidase [Sphingomonas desiccabilis]MBB3911974.1 serine protease Do [Sphingomonas desiccabilis]RXZ31327.1 Do family serine endopeptidase [Sphingomonas desiccabilis]
MRYAYALTSALLLGGTAAAFSFQPPAGAQTAQNEPGAIASTAPRAGAPMSFADLVARLQPAVVNISTTQRVTVQQSNPFAGTPFEQFFGSPRGGAGPRTQEAQSLGSGFLISADGYVVTNNHVVSAGTASAVVETITVTLSDRREFKARLVGRDAASDLAVLKIEGATFPFVRFGDSRQARVGDWVVAIGNPFGLSGSVTAGIVSAINRVTGGGTYDRFIQTDAAINRGNSGGPMFDLQGNVIGINSQILSPTGGNIGIGLAIPAEQAKPIVDKLMRGQAIERGYLGVGIQPIDENIGAALGLPKDRGELISRIEPGEAAAKAGIRQGDVVVAVNGKEVTPEQTLSYLVANTAPGTRIPVELLRDGKRQTVTVTVGKRPPEEQLAQFNPEDDSGMPQAEAPQDTSSASLGIGVTPLTPSIARSIGVDPAVKGVVVTGTDPSSDAAGKGIRRGDVIVSVNRTPVANAADVARQVTQAKAAGRDQVLLFVQRRGQGIYMPVRIGG